MRKRLNAKETERKELMLYAKERRLNVKERRLNAKERRLNAKERFLSKDVSRKSGRIHR